MGRAGMGMGMGMEIEMEIGTGLDLAGLDWAELSGLPYGLD